MNTGVAIIIGVAAIGILVALLRGGSSKALSGDAVIDPTDARQIGTLIGLMGGSVADAAIAQSALRRFEEIHGRKATVREMGLVAGMIKGMR